jgi:riboflavin kinase
VVVGRGAIIVCIAAQQPIFGVDTMPNPSKHLPIRMVSRVVRGFGRGSKDLGIPTANVCLEKDTMQCSIVDYAALPTGIYWGFARIDEPPSASSVKDEEVSSDSVLGKVHTAAISIGYNPTYNNKDITVEPHLIAEPEHPQRHASTTGETQFQDFYDKKIVLSVVGYLRPELPFEGLEKLTDAIKKDIADSVHLANGSDPFVLAEKEWVASASDVEP